MDGTRCTGDCELVPPAYNELGQSARRCALFPWEQPCFPGYQFDVISQWHQARGLDDDGIYAPVENFLRSQNEYVWMDVGKMWRKICFYIETEDGHF